MRGIERKLVEHLEAMRDRFGIVALKAEFEAMGIRLEELRTLVYLARQADLGVMQKIGGPEDVWGILQACETRVAGIVAPMVESAFALSKFLEALRKHVRDEELEQLFVAVNVETVQAVNALEEMLVTNAASGKMLHAITVGRVDLTGSAFFDPVRPEQAISSARVQINSDAIYRMVEQVGRAAKHADLEVTVGGGIEPAAKDFIERLTSTGLIDRFETRMAIFDARATMFAYDEAVRAAHELELLWLELKAELYDAKASEDSARMKMLAERINKS